MNWLKNTACVLGIGAAGLVGCHDYEADQKRCWDRLKEATRIAEEYQLHNVKSEIGSKKHCQDKYRARSDFRMLKYLLNDDTEIRCNTTNAEAWKFLDHPLSQFVFQEMNFCENRNYYGNINDIDKLNHLIKKLKEYKRNK